mmetsp:Transcript_6499/g.8991  ORF Transcript_6499/g.8991 Transcript_6499/m.8991 type:complete len:112 (-) Transcript_6499:288-623(-)
MASDAEAKTIPSDIKAGAEEFAPHLNCIYETFVEHVCLDLAFESHKTHYLGIYVKNRSKKDIYGNYPKNFSETIKCPNCKRSVTSTKFAPHLEKCMGKTGRGARYKRMDSS